jgi:hypothetical protein
MSEWQPIETAPKDGAWVLLGDFKEHAEGEHSQGVARFTDGRWTDGFGPEWYWANAFCPTHWMALPTPPSAR